MKHYLEDHFDEIQQDAIIEAEKVDCSKETFLEGLKIMRDCLQSRIESYTDEISNKNH